MSWLMQRTRNRSAFALAAYWDDVVRQQPATPVPAAEIPTSQGAMIRQLHTLEQHDPSTPSFQDDLLQRLLATYEETTPMTDTTAAALPQPRMGLRIAPPRRPRSKPNPFAPVRRYGMPVLEIAMILLLLIASAAGIWLAGSHDDDRVRLAAPATPVATPTSEAAPGWTHFKGDSARRGETNFGPVNQPVELWRYQASDPCNPSPAAVGDTVYVACGGMLTAFDVATGTVSWQFSVEVENGPAEQFVDGPSVAGGIAYVVGGSGILYAVDIATGTERWRVEGNAFAHSPAVTGDTLVAGTSDGALIGIDTATGTQRWRTQVVDTGLVRSPALADGIAYAGSEFGGLVAIDMATGELLWRADTGPGTSGTAIVADGIAYIGATASNLDSGSVSAYDAATGELLWRNDQWRGAPSTSGGIGVSVHSPQGGISAFDMTTGDELWSISVSGEIRPIAVSREIVYVPSDGDRAIYAFDVQTGDMLWSIEVDGGMWGGPAVTDGRIFVATTFGVVQAFGESDAGVVAASPETTPAATLSATPEATPAS